MQPRARSRRGRRDPRSSLQLIGGSGPHASRSLAFALCRRWAAATWPSSARLEDSPQGAAPRLFGRISCRARAARVFAQQITSPSAARARPGPFIFAQSALRQLTIWPARAARAGDHVSSPQLPRVVRVNDPLGLSPRGAARAARFTPARTPPRSCALVAPGRQPARWRTPMPDSY